MITEPVPRAVMCAPAAWQIHIVVSRLSRSTLSQPDWRMSRKELTKLEPPALFTTMSSWPSSLMAMRTESSAAARSVRSAGISTAWRPRPRISSAVFASPASVPAVIATSAPARANATAMTSPMPRDAPVTSAFLPARLNSGSVTALRPTRLAAPPSRQARPG